MTQVYPLDPVIRLFEPGSVPPGKAQKIVMIEVGRRVVTPHAPWFREVRSYLVSNTRDARHVGTGCISGLLLNDLEWSVAVSLTFDARCRSGNEEKVALALFAPVEMPGAILEDYLTNWLKDMSEDVAVFVDAYFADPRALEAQLAERAQTELSLELRVRLTLDAERSLNTIFVSDTLLVTVSDYDNEQHLVEFTAGLEVDDRSRTRAILQSNRYDDLHDLVPREIGKFIRHNVSMQTFYMQLNGPAVREPLTRHLNTFLAPFGRKIETLTLESDQSEVQVHYRDDIDVFCRLHQYPREVKISNNVQMILADVARYKAAKAPPLKEWLQEKLKRFIPQTLFGARYIEVLLRFPPLEREIKRSLGEQAAAIGYDIEQFVTVPDLAPLRWKEPFPVNTDGSFATRQSDVFVKIEIAVTAMIPRLEEIENLLNLDQDVPSLMPAAIREVVAEFLHSCEPERFYMRFNFTEKRGEITVEQALDQRIRAKLTGGFHADVISVIVKMADAEPKIRLRALQGKICSFEVHVDSLHVNDPLIFAGTFQVEAVDENGWNKFQMLPATLDEIRLHLEGHLASKLQTQQVRHILFRLPEEQEDLSDRLRKSAVDYVRRQFGLSINVDSIRRELTQWERAALQVEVDKTNARLTIAKSDVERKIRMHIALYDEREAQVTKLLQERTRLALNEVTQEELDEHEQKITDAQGRVPDEPIPSMASVQALLLPERARNNGKAPQGALGAAQDEEAQQPRGEDGECSRAEKDARIRQRIAVLSPRMLLRKALFWKGQRTFLIAIAVGVSALIILAPHTYASAGGWELLVLAVHLLAVWGAVITARALAALEVEQAIVGEIEARGAEMLRKIRSEAQARVDLDLLGQYVLPGNTSIPPPAMIRLFQHIIKEAHDRKFESSVSVMQPYREEPLSDLFQLQNLQKVALWLGILGTFIGLLVAMQAADLKQLLSRGAMIELVEKMFGGMIISFSASLAGLQVAVILGMFLVLLRQRQVRYFKAMETAVVTMLSLARNTINKDEYIAEFGQIRDTVTRLTDRVQQQSRELTRTQQRIHDQTDRIGAGMSSVADAGASFDGFLQRISDAQNTFIGDLTSVYDTISLRELSANLQRSVGEAGQMMAERIGGGANLIGNRLVDFNRAVAKVATALETQAYESEETGKKLRDQITASTNESVLVIRGIGKQMQELLNRESSSASSVRSEMVELARRVNELSGAIDRIQNLPPPKTRSVRDIIFSLRW